MKTAILGYRTKNLGDDMQAISAAAHLPWIDAIAHRDRLDAARLSEPHLTIMASWFLVRNWKRPPTAEIAPLFYGFCLGRDELLETGWRGYLERHAPIGARDTRTVEKLSGVGIEAFRTGCITLFLGRMLEPVPPEKRSGVVLVDVPESAMGLIPPEIVARAETITNQSPPEVRYDPLARVAHIARIAERLRRAEMVVTRRLHTALPCVGFRTPVVAIVEDTPSNRGRFSGYDRFLPVIFHKGGAPVSGAVDWEGLGPARPTEDLDSRYADLRTTLQERLGPHEIAPSPSLFERFTLRVPAPAGWRSASAIEIDLGMTRVRRPVSAATAPDGSPAFEAEIEAVSPFRRLRAPVSLIGGPFGLRRARAGAFDDLVI
jgi:hypothetical protein